ncbi:hypothetical protein QBC43DRAFT_313785, partial [Cladorrhinum sp. PSN259]
MAINPTATRTEGHPATSLASKASFSQSISKLRNRIFPNSSSSPGRCSNTVTSSQQHAEKSPQLPMPRSFPSDSSLILTNRLADKQAVFTSKLTSLNQSFQLGLEAQGVPDPETARATLRRYHQSIHPDTERYHSYNTDSKDRQFYINRRQLTHESHIMATSLSRKICLGYRLRKCLNLVSALGSNQPSLTPRQQQRHMPLRHDNEEEEDAVEEPPSSSFSFWESRRTQSQEQQPSFSSPGLSSNSSSSPPSTPGCYYSFFSSQFSYGSLLLDDDGSRAQTPNTEPDREEEEKDMRTSVTRLLLLPQSETRKEDHTNKDEESMGLYLQIPRHNNNNKNGMNGKGKRESTCSITAPSSSGDGDSIYYSMDDEEEEEEEWNYRG